MSLDGSNFGPEEPPPYTYQIGEEETVIEAILRAVGTVADIPVGARVDETGSVRETRDQPPPLYRAVDVDALRSLASDSSADGDSWTVTFSYCGCEVTVSGDDTVVVEERTSATEG